MDDEKRNEKTDDRTMDQIERDLEGTREKLADDLDALGRKVSPQRLRDDALGSVDDVRDAAMERVDMVASQVSHRAAAAGERIVEGIRAEPMPLALVLAALGAGSVLMQSRRRGHLAGYPGSEAQVRGEPQARGRASAVTVHRDSDTGDAVVRSHRATHETGGYAVRVGEDETSSMGKKGLLVGLGALAAGAVVGTLLSIEPKTAARAQGALGRVRERAGEIVSNIADRFSGSSDGAKGSGIQVRERIRVNKPAAELYTYWRDLENLPQVMRHLEEVVVTDGKRSHWVAKGPANVKVEWDAVITDERPNDVIAWRSAPGSGVPNEGAVKFLRVGANTTDIIVSLTYHPPAGKLGALVARLFGEEPSHQVSDDLERFKEEVEAGRMSLTRGVVVDGSTPTAL